MNPELTSTVVTETELTAFLADLNLVRRLAYEKSFDGKLIPAPLAYDERETLVAAISGPKFIKVSVSAKVPHCVGQKAICGRFPTSTYCFIEVATGSILLPKDANAPVKGARGNIRSAYWGTTLNQYGCAYLR